nr:hypothetical protein [Rhodoferax sp.]
MALVSMRELLDHAAVHTYDILGNDHDFNVSPSDKLMISLLLFHAFGCTCGGSCCCCLAWIQTGKRARHHSGWYAQCA